MTVVEGLPSLLRKLDRLGGVVDQSLKIGMLQAAHKVQGDAKDLCPVDEGILRNSIQAGVRERDGKTEGFISTNIYYAPYVEFGTGQRGEASVNPPPMIGRLRYRQDWRGNRAQPFLYPAAVQNKKIVPQIVKDKVKRDIIRLMGGGA